MKPVFRVFAWGMLLVPALAMAQQAAPAATRFPEWERLTPAEREVLIAPLRERWNAEPDARERMFRHAERWKTMPPDQRRKAQRGMHRWEGMPEPKRDRARALFEHMRSLTPDQRQAFLAQWRAMTGEQRQAWVQAQQAARPQRKD